MKTSITTIGSSIDLWNQFCRTADFKSNEYDKQLLVEIKKRLGLDEKSNIRFEIKARNITPQQLLSAILTSLKPFSLMTNDLLKMFEVANAKYTNNNIQIKFDFEDAKANFGLDLENFRVCQESIEKTVDYELQFELCSPFKDFVHPLERILDSNKNMVSNHDKRIPDEIAQWLDKYKTDNENWPDFIPLPPKSGIKRIDSLVAEIWLIPKAACDIYNKCYQSKLGRIKSLNEKTGHSYTDEIDYWIGSFVKQVCIIVNEIRKYSEEAKKPNPNIDRIGDMLEKYRDSIPIFSIESERLLKKFLDLLNLPVWEKRYALYSAWVSTQIIAAFDKDKVRFNVVGGVLSYSFSGSTIAYIEHDTVELKLIAELRTPYEGVKGHGRKHNIQPDYSLCIGDESDPRNTFLVVECKQYKKPSKKNFTEAVEDYAGGRPTAQVLLVNYKAIPESFRSKLSATVSERVPFFEALTPGNSSSDKFIKAIRESLPKRYIISLFSRKPTLNMESKLLVYQPNGDTIEINRLSRGSEKQFPFAESVDNDALGVICEEIRFLSFRTMKYEYYVHNFRRNTPNEEAFVAFADKKTFAWIKNGISLKPSEIWHAFTIVHSRVHFVDEISSDSNL